MRRYVLWILLAGIYLWVICSCQANPVNQVNAGQSPDLLETAETPPVLDNPPTLTFEPSKTIQPTLTATLTPTVTLTPAPSFPEKHHIENITGHKQFFPLGCETAAAIDWAWYFGISINEYEFQVKLPQSDNPDFGFVGGLQGPWGQVPPYSYGVHAGPIATLLREYGLPATSGRNLSLDNIKEQVSNNQPVIVWVIGNMVGGVPAEYTDKEGNKVTVAAYEHVVIITGYDDASVRYMNNGKFYEAPNKVFLNSWGVLENMAVFLEN